MDQSSLCIKLKPTNLHFRKNGEVTVHFNFPLQSSRAQVFKISVPIDKLTQAFNTLHVSLDGPSSKATPRVIFPSPHFVSNTESVYYLKSKIGAIVELKDNGQATRGILRHVSYERSLQLINIVLQDLVDREVVSAHLIQPNYEEILKFISHPDSSQRSLSGICSYSTSDILIYVDEVDGAIDSQLRYLRASYCITQRKTKNGFDIRYHLTIPGKARLRIDEVRKGRLQAFALFENPLPERLENVEVSLSVSPFDLIGDLWPLYDYREKVIETADSDLDESERTESDSETHNASENAEDNEDSVPLLLDILKLFRKQAIGFKRTMAGFSRALNCDEKLFHVDQRVYLECGQSTRISLFDLYLDAKLHHFAEVIDPKKFDCGSVEVVMSLLGHNDRPFIPSIITIQGIDKCLKNTTGYMRRCGTITDIQEDLALHSSVFYKFWKSWDRFIDNELHEKTQLLQMSVLDGNLFRTFAMDHISVMRAINCGSSTVNITLPFLREIGNNDKYISVEVLQYKGIEDAVLSNSVGSNEQRGTRLAMVESDEPERATVYGELFGKLGPFDECIFVMKERQRHEFVHDILEIDNSKINRLCAHNSVSKNFLNRLHLFGEADRNTNIALNEQSIIEDRLAALQIAEETAVEDDDIDLSFIEDNHNVNGSYEDIKYIALRQTTAALKEQALQEQRNCNEIVADQLMEKNRLYRSIANVSYKTITSK